MKLPTPTSIARVTASITALCCISAVDGGSASAAGNTHGEFDFAGLLRTYQLHVPAGLDHPSGLVINLHGSGATGGEQAALTGYDGVADRHGFAVVYPDGVDYSWADGRGASTPDREGVDDVGFLTALADQLVREYGIDPGRVFATGMSAGGFMANRLACDRADVVAAIAPVAGTLGSNVGCGPSRPVAVMEIHGTADPVVPYGGGPMVGRGGPSDIVAAPELASRWRAIDGCPAPVDTGQGTAVHRIAAAGCAGGTEVVLVGIEGAGHTWPSSDFNASEVSGQFFAAHGR
jgi:polyhydroxybutyrate depolymerase